MTAVLRLHARLLRVLGLRLRGRVQVPAGGVALAYGASARVTGTAFLVATVLEAALLHLVLPWPAVQVLSLVLSAWALVLVLAMLAEPRVLPHVLEPGALRLRAPGGIEVVVPLPVVDRVARVRSQGSRVEVVEGVLVLPSDGQTVLELLLAEPLEVDAGPLRGPVRRVRLSVDDPAAALAAVHAALERQRAGRDAQDASGRAC